MRNNVVDHFRPGNIIWSGYWRSYDLVLEFHPITRTRSHWEVKVISCDERGIPLPSAQPRTHCTTPEYSQDRVVGSGQPPD